MYITKTLLWPCSAASPGLVASPALRRRLYMSPWSFDSVVAGMSISSKCERKKNPYPVCTNFTANKGGGGDGRSKPLRPLAFSLVFVEAGLFGTAFFVLSGSAVSWLLFWTSRELDLLATCLDRFFDACFDGLFVGCFDGFFVACSEGAPSMTNKHNIHIWTKFSWILHMLKAENAMIEIKNDTWLNVHVPNFCGGQTVQRCILRNLYVVFFSGHSRKKTTRT